VHERLKRKYPQIDDLRVVRKFPNQISVLAKERLPFAQTIINDKVLTIDDHGVILSTTSKRDKRLPYIEGLEDKNHLYALGHPLTGTKILVGLSYVRYFVANRQLDNHLIQTINVSNLSQVEMLVDNGLMILLDRDNIERKMKVLGVVLAQKNLDFSQIRYIDLRFKEPIIGKK
ncbi:MAG: cell division protein FtsQ/DivIB, partial [Candidatus Omnitrophica bacterium]|nr:cell division protein FtsQ/DivIB [Candidatus Omnitrophota bacterium]